MRIPQTRLAAAFGNTPERWVNFQAAYDLARERPATKIKPIRAAGARR